MGSVGQTGSDAEADAFFAQFINAPAEVIQRVAAEQDGNLAAIAAEDKAFGYWQRLLADREARRIEHDRLVTLERAKNSACTAPARSPKEQARLAPLPAQSAILLPEPRFVILTDPEYNDTARWWHRLENEMTARSLARRIRNEVRDAQQAQRRVSREAAAWRAEQRAFERAQWKAVVANRNSRPKRKTENQWVAIGEDRALAIALTALEKATPPQGQK